MARRKGRDSGKRRRPAFGQVLVSAGVRFEPEAEFAIRQIFGLRPGTPIFRPIFRPIVGAL